MNFERTNEIICRQKHTQNRIDNYLGLLAWICTAVITREVNIWYEIMIYDGVAGSYV
jgi:hypothetical protein